MEDEPAVKALIELGKTGAQNVMYGVMATLVNVTNSYDKQEINPEMLELAKFAKHHIPEEHELDDEDFADKRICTIANLGVTSALVALAKTESLNMRELIGRVMNAICKHAELRGLVVQQGGSKALIPLALEGTDKGRVVAAQVFLSWQAFYQLFILCVISGAFEDWDYSGPKHCVPWTAELRCGENFFKCLPPVLDLNHNDTHGNIIKGETHCPAPGL